MQVNKKFPNIILIFADDMGYGDVGVFNPQSKIPTPNMDRLASEGISFTDAHSSSAVCTPSRYSLLTGRYCWRSRLKNGVLGGFGAPLIEPGRMTLAALLRENNYQTAAIGKWHLGFDWIKKDGRLLGEVSGFNQGWDEDGFDIDYSKPLRGGPVDNGFDYFFGISASLDMPPYCFIENDHTVGIPDREKEIYYNQQRRGLQVEDWQDEEVDLTFASKSVEFIKKQNKKNPEKPFFLYLATAAPHRPCDIRPDFVKGKSEAGDRGDMVVLFDHIVGQVMETLENLGIEENTLLMVTSDNGARATCANGRDYGHQANGNWRGQKADIWDGGHREPFIARWPEQIKAGQKCDEVICLSDILATCAAIIDNKLPEDAGEDSFNILPLLQAKNNAPVRETIIHHSLRGHFSIRKGKWKLVDMPGSGGFTEPVNPDIAPGEPAGQLYNLEEDPGEKINLWLQRQDKVKELFTILKNYQIKARSNPDHQ